jgi:benzoylformate decarboxylase
MPELISHQLLLEQLEAEGIRYVFGTPRSRQSPVIQAVLSSSEKIQYIETLHENVACGMATGYAQASGTTGVVSLPTAPGMISALPAVYNAMRTRVPLVILCDQPDIDSLNDEPPLSADIVSLSSTLSKWACQLNTAAEIPRVIRRAFHEALSAPKGPVVISLPINILGTKVSSGTVAPPHLSPLGAADSSFLKKAAKHLVGAKMPCIIAGNEVSHYRARADVVSLAEVLGCPVFIEPLPTGVNFPNRHNLFASVLPDDAAKAFSILKPFDTFLVLGVHTRPVAKPFEPPFISPSATVLQINIEPGLHGRALPNELSATADLKESLSRLRSEIQLFATSDWINAAMQRAERTSGVIDAGKRSYHGKLKYPSHSGAISLPWLLKTLETARPKKSVVVSDLNGAEPSIMESLAFEHSFAFFASNSGTLGYAPAAAQGVQLASSDSTVICLTDDQSLLSCPQALWSSCHYDLDTKFIMVNSLGSKVLNIKLKFHSDEFYRGLEKHPVGFANLARSMGLSHVLATDMGSLENGLKTIFEERGPHFLEVLIA